MIFFHFVASSGTRSSRRRWILPVGAANAMLSSKGMTMAMRSTEKVKFLARKPPVCVVDDVPMAFYVAVVSLFERSGSQSSNFGRWIEEHRDVVKNAAVHS